MADRNLDLDMERRPDDGDTQQIARVAVVLACGFARGGGATTITRECSSYEDFEREVKRLKQELDSILARARKRFDGALDTAGGERNREGASAPDARPARPRDKPRIGGDLRVRDVMTRDVKTLGRNEKLAVADELMQVGKFRHVVVLDDDGKVAGIVSQRNIFYGALAWSLGQGQIAHQKALESFLVKDIMEANPLTIHSDAPLARAAETMMERKIGCLPVVEDDRLVGILTEGDFLALLSGSGQLGKGG